jgi:hypothetical protein
MEYGSQLPLGNSDSRALGVCKQKALPLVSGTFVL